MFKISNVKTRYFEFEAPDDLRALHIEPPKLKTIRQMQNISKKDEPGVDDMARVVAKIIGKNKEGRPVNPDLVMDWMDFDQLGAFIDAFLSWMNDAKTKDPN